MKQDDVGFAVVGLGYVGLPLAAEFAKQLGWVGYDTQRERVEELQAGEDRTLGVSPEELVEVEEQRFSDGNPEPFPFELWAEVEENA